MNIFNHAMERMDKYIWSLAHKFGKNLHGMDVKDLHQEGLIKLYEIYTSSKYAGKPVEELDAIFAVSLKNAFSDLATKAGNVLSRHSSLDEWLAPDSTVEVDLSVIAFDAFEDVYLRHYQEHLSHFVSPEAAILLDALLNPTPAVLHLQNIQNMRRAHIQRQGFNVHINKKIPNQITGLALGFSPSKTKALIRELQLAWRTVCQTNSLKLNAAMC